MRRLVLVLALAAAVLCAAGSATSAGAPTQLVVDEEPFQLGIQPAVDALLTISPAAPATAAVVWYVPRGYAVNLALAPGTKLGSGSVKFASGGVVTAGQGTLTADDPAKHTTDACAPGAHAAVWLLSATLSGQPFVLPLYVDTPAPPASNDAMLQIRACFDPPATSSRTLSAVELVVTNGITNPAAASEYVWRAIVTPYGAGDLPNANGGVEAQALVPLPHRVAVKATYSAKRRTVTISGVAIAGRGRDGATPVSIYTTPDLARGPFRRLGTVTTDARGAFSLTRSFARTAYVVVFVERTSYGSDCESTISSSPCSFETVASSDQAIRRVVVPGRG